MAARIERLKRRSEFLRVAGARRKWVTPGLIVQAAPRETARDGDAGFRVGFTASRRVGGAVERNRARRRLRAAAERVMPERAERGVDYVVIARKATVSRPFEALSGDLADALDGLARRGAATRPSRGADTRQ